jgi:hypothetical protein
MGKVITGAGLNEFISSGKVEEIKDAPKPKAAKDAPALEVVKIAGDGGGEKKAEAKEDDAPAEELSSAEEIEAAIKGSDALADYVTKKNATINRKHAQMREAQKAADEAEEFAKGQYTRARLAEERAAQIERELADFRSKAAPAAEKAPESVEPDPAKFYDDKGQFKAFEYAKELASYAAKKAVEEDRAKVLAERQAAEAAAAEAQARARVAASIKKYPDFEHVLGETDTRLHTRVLEYLSASDYIGDVSYYLAKHPDYVERINKLNPLKAIAEIGKLELTFEPKTEDTTKTVVDEVAAKVTTGAPPPIKPLTASGSVNVNTDPAKMSFRDLRAYERSRAAAKRR